MFYEKTLTESGVKILKNVSAVKLSTYKGGGEVETLVLPDGNAEFAYALRILNDAGENVYILGGGSDTLIADGTLHSPVISTAALDFIKFDSNFIKAGAGVQIGKIIAAAAKNGLGGLEFLAGVPATLGGALKMNAGAFGHSIAEVLVCARVLNSETASISEIRAADVGFAYRKGVSGTVVSAVLKLEYCSEERIRQRAGLFLKERRSKQPSEPSLGSVFKNPDNAPCAGRLIEKANLEGRVSGGAKISQKHANFIINIGGGSAADYLALAKLAATAVESKFGIVLTPEFHLLSDT